MSSNQTEYIAKSFFPDSLLVALRRRTYTANNHRRVKSESDSGRNLLLTMISERYNTKNAEFTTEKYEKPSATVDGDIISVSFSHTPEAVCATISRKWVVGIDMESTKRVVADRLSSRMKHPDEAFKFYKERPIIQIWTMKEAALKAIGTGLRQPMNSVKLDAITDYLFRVEFLNGTRANICSFQIKNQWISICYISSKISESFLSKSYVPIYSGRDKEQT